jgi:hypothetical protein
MADKADIRWDVASASRGSCCWVERDGVFFGIESGKDVLAFDKLDLEQFEPKVRKDGPCVEKPCPALFPADFAACPNCGADLTPMFAGADRLWSFPGPDGDGLLNAESVEIGAISSAPQPDSPNGNDLTLIVAGRPRRLFAFDRSSSEVQVYNRQSRSWRDFPSNADFHSTLPLWSWTVLSFDGGFALAGHDSFLIGELDAFGLGIDFAASPKDLGTPLGGPAILADRLAFLSLAENGALIVVAYDPRRKSWTKECEVTSAAGCSSGDYFAAPVTKAFGTYWASTKGYVALRAAANAWDAVWRPWNDGFVPELQVRPLWTKSAFWQLGALGGNASFEQFARIGEQRSQSNISGPHLTAGECSFSSGMTIYVTPWDPNSSQTIRANSDSFLMPITGLRGLDAVVADCGYDPGNMRLDPSELFRNGDPKLAQLLIYKSGRLINLNQAIRISNVLQLQAVVFDGQLMIYDRDGACIYAWKFE